MAKEKRSTKVTFNDGTLVTIYSGKKVQAALEEVSEEMTLYKGVRLLQLLESFYTQGHRDGAKSAFEEISKGVLAAQKRIPHRTPGRPRKRN
jgi:hypothetical protein